MPRGPVKGTPWGVPVGAEKVTPLGAVSSLAMVVATPETTPLPLPAESGPMSIFVVPEAESESHISDEYNVLVGDVFLI